MAIVSRDALGEPALHSEIIAVPELGGDVEVRALPLDAIQRLLMDARAEPERAVSRLLAATVYASDGLPLWTADQWAVWGGGRVAAVMRLYGTAQRVCGLGVEAAEAAEKN